MQCAAIPYRWTQTGGLDILLVTTRGKGRGRENWIIPKGKVKPGKGAALSAAEEAYEEAGVRGTLDQAPVARFDLPMAGRESSEQMQIFALEVENQTIVWPEMFQRQRRWASLDEAMAMLKAPHFRQALQDFAAMMAPLV
jgi:8-oxo-dGTP pyrophosphatase MutT (NUDIX family)